MSVVLLIILFIVAYLAFNHYYNPQSNKLPRHRQQAFSKRQNNIINQSNPRPFDKINEDQSKEKGLSFEKYICLKFDRAAFELKEWRSDKFHEGRYATSNKLPDMEWELVSPYAKKTSFAVECKYRSSYTNDCVEIAKEYQLKNYQEFSRQERKPVFIVLGVGGFPSEPKDLFIIPLKDIRSNIISSSELIKYKKRKVDGTFFYDVQRKALL